MTEFYINGVPECFIPINEGDEELIYAYLTANIFDSFCWKKSYPKNNKKDINIYKEDINNFETFKKKRK